MAVSNGSILLNFERISPRQQAQRVKGFVETMHAPSQTYHFSNRSVPEEVIEKIIHSAGTSPSGANQQPWTFVLIKDPLVKRDIKTAAEHEEQAFMEKHQEADTSNKEFFESAPYLVALFKQKYGVKKRMNGSVEKVKHYYPNESTAICAGFFISALQHAGLDYMIHGPVKAMNDILNRPDHEAPFLLFAIGYAKEHLVPCPAPLNHLVDSDVNLSFESDEGVSKSCKRTFDGEEEQKRAAVQYYEFIKQRRNVRHYSTEEVDIKLIKQALNAINAASAPTGSEAFRFVLVRNPATKARIREQAESEEKKFYEQKITDEWRGVLQPLGTNWQKPHLTDAPYLIVALKIDHPASSTKSGSQLINTKSMSLISTGIAIGILMSALHHAGLCTLTHTPSPMAFLRDLLERPKQEMPIVVLPVGYPAEHCEVPNITKKPLEDILVKY